MKVGHQCHICGINKQEKLSLIEHLRKCDDGRQSKCEDCGKIFTGKLKLKSHRRIHLKTECGECGMEMPFGSMNDHMKTHQMKPNQVLFCNKWGISEIKILNINCIFGFGNMLL